MSDRLISRVGVFTVRNPWFNLAFKWKAAESIVNVAINDGLPKLEDEISSTMRYYLEQIVKDAKKNAASNFDGTGRLRESIHYRKTGYRQYELVADVPYAKYAEYGIFGRGSVRLEGKTGAQAEREISEGYVGTPSTFNRYAFMRPAIYKYKSRIEKKLEQDLESLMGE